MSPHRVALLTVLLMIGTAAPAAAQDRLEVHEWGSLSTVLGADGKARGGMEVNLRELPKFVLRWSTVPMRARLHIKEKPILYFYPERKMHVSVKVASPDGMWTEWWPPAHEFAPRTNGDSQKVKAKNGWLDWRRVELLPTKPASPVARKAPASSWYPVLRDVDACWLRVRGQHYRRGGTSRQGWFDELERFLLYRGVTNRRESVTVSVTCSDDGTVGIRNTGTATLGKMLVLDSSDKTGWWHLMDTPAPGKRIELKPADRRKISAAQLESQTSKAMIKLLVDAGLFAKEAQGMTKIWTPDWFRSPGLRVLYLMPRDEIDRLMPLVIKPKPSKIVRVVVNRIECLTPDRVVEIRTRIARLGARMWKDRDRAARELRRLGRIAEPLLREALASAEDLEIRSRIEGLLKLLDPAVRGE